MSFSTISPPRGLRRTALALAKTALAVAAGGGIAAMAIVGASAGGTESGAAPRGDRLVSAAVCGAADPDCSGARYVTVEQRSGNTSTLMRVSLR